MGVSHKCDKRVRQGIRPQASSWYRFILVRTFMWVGFVWVNICIYSCIWLNDFLLSGQLAHWWIINQFKYMEHYPFAVWNTSIILLVWVICPITINNNHWTTNNNHSMTARNSKHSRDRKFVNPGDSNEWKSCNINL